jgi:iron complex outermembrane receptor protein
MRLTPAAVSAESFAPVTTVPGTEIVATPGATITDSLQELPGITGTTFAPGANRPIVRGLDGNRLRIQEGGLTTGDVSDVSEDHGVPVDPCTVERLSVIRGPAALRFTNKAAAGVVDAETNSIPTEVPANGISGEVRGGLTSVDNGRDGCFTTSAGSRGFVVQGGAFSRHADDYHTPSGVQENSFVDSKGSSIGGAYVWRDGFAGIAYSRIASLYAVPGLESAEERSRIDLEQQRLTAKGEWRLRDMGLEAIRASFASVDYGHNELVFEDGADAVGSRFINKAYEGRAEIDHAKLVTPFGVLRGTAGIQVSNRDLTGLSFEGDNLIEPSTTRKTAGFLFEELRLSHRLRLLGSVRLQNDAVTGSTYADASLPGGPLVDYDKSFDTKSGSVGLLYDLPLGVVARLTGLYAERAPEAQELFSKGAHEATETFEIGNPDLTLEKSSTIEGGFRREKGALRFDATAYYTQYSGFIYRQLTGESCDADLASCSPGGAGGDLMQVVFGQRDASFYGTELSGEYDVARVWRGVWGISGRYDFVRARFEDGENVPRIPPHRLGGGLYYRDGQWRAQVSLLHAFRHDETAVDETATSGYTLLNAGISYTMKLASDGAITPELTIGLKGDNLLDEDVRNSASFKKDEVLEPGRNVRLYGTVRF